MSTIPSIFNEHQINMLVLGGTEAVPNVRLNIAAVVLNKGWSQFRTQAVENLAKCGFSEIIFVEADSQNYNLENFASRYPFVKFIVPLEEATDGEFINIAAGEIKSDFFLVLRDSLDFSHGILSPTLSKSLENFGAFCVAPRLLSEEMAFPILYSPEIHKGIMRLAATSTVSDGLPDLMPFDYIGLYNREKFIAFGGFDYTIRQSYWQNLDLSFRAWLFGEKIILSTAFCLNYSGKFPALDTTPSQDSNRFYLKNLVPRFYDDHGSIPRSSFFSFLRSSSCGFFEAKRQFKEARRWVDKNKYNFKRDVIDLVENWSS